MLGWPVWILTKELGWRSPSIVDWRGRLLGAWHLRGTVHLLVTLVKAQLMSLLPQASKVNFWFNAKLSKHVRYAEEKRRKRKERPFGPKRRAETKSHFLAIFVWVLERERHRETESFSLRGAVRMKRLERNTVSVWESEKEKRIHFFFLLKLHTRMINWWSSHGVFECYNYEKLEYSEER